MNTATLRHPTATRWTAWWHAVTAARAASAAAQQTRDTAASLHARAAQYEASQPGFAADLRSAAESLDRLAAPCPR
jgi:hypothetical protein